MLLDDKQHRLRKRQKKLFAKKLRKRSTPQEILLWEKLRDRRFIDWKFCRQVPIGPFIADFLSKRFRLIVEVDGAVHHTVDGRARDKNRDEYFHNLHYKILHVLNDEVEDDMNSVLHKIKHAVLRDTQTYKNHTKQAPLPGLRPGIIEPQPHPDDWQGRERGWGEGRVRTNNKSIANKQIDTSTIN